MTKSVSLSGSMPMTGLLVRLIVCPTENSPSSASFFSMAHSPAVSGRRPESSTGLVISSGTSMTVTSVMLLPMRSWAPVCRTASAAPTPGRARMASRSSSSISRVELTWRSQSPLPLKKMLASFSRVAAA